MPLVKNRTGNANRERSDDFSVKQVQKFTQNTSLSRFTQDSPSGIFNQKIPKKAQVTSTLPS